MVGVRSRASFLVTTLVLIAAFLVVDQPPAQALGNANLHVRRADSVLPGSSMYVEGDWWFPSTTCPNKVRIEIKDSQGRTTFVDRVRTREWTQSDPSGGGGASHDAYFIDSIVRVPHGVAPGPGTVIARQSFEIKFPVFGCIRLARKSGHQAVTVAGPEGGDPPQITTITIPTEMRQGQETTLGWTSSEPCTMDIKIAYELEPGREIAAGTALAEPRAGGRQVATWDVTDDPGAPLPAGSYVAYLQCRDDTGINSAVHVRRFHVGFGE